jgi:hypothetical protein
MNRAGFTPTGSNGSDSDEDDDDRGVVVAVRSRGRDHADEQRQQSETLLKRTAERKAGTLKSSDYHDDRQQQRPRVYHVDEQQQHRQGRARASHVAGDNNAFPMRGLGSNPGGGTTDSKAAGDYSRGRSSLSAWFRSASDAVSAAARSLARRRRRRRSSESSSLDDGPKGREK